MTNQEFSNEFDILYNNIMSNLAPGLDEYEKSVFLTKAQDEIIKNYFNPKGNKYGEGFDGNEKRQIDFSMITKIKSFQDISLKDAIFDNKNNSRRVELDSDIMMFINEFADVIRDTKTIRLTVIPLLYKNYSRLMSKPYKRPLHYLAWRIMDNSLGNLAEIIVGPSDTLIKYSIRYIRKPKAIILSPLEGVTLDGTSSKQECELDPIIHLEILLRAVELAKAAYIGDLNSNVELGKRSE